jgi:hypothetical protein
VIALDKSISNRLWQQGRFFHGRNRRALRWLIRPRRNDLIGIDLIGIDQAKQRAR